ncbi:MAG: YesN/AraC family two-component response regulator, partial [Bacteroidia bacterium]
SDGLAGLNMIKRFQPDLVISDVLMPKMDGFEMLNALKSDEQTSLIPLIFLTAKASFNSRLEGLEFGADDYIIKPFHNDELLVKIRNTIETRKKLLQMLYMSPEKVVSESSDDKFLKQTKSAIEHDISNQNFGLEDLAKALNTSTSSLQKKLKRICEKSVSQFIREYRLKRSRDLIDLGYGNLSEIADKAGFRSLSYFSKCFKDFYGTNPKST